MSAVYTFSRSESEILQELLKIFEQSRNNYREQWSMQAEALVEPVGWDALWKLSKEFCKKFEVRFPCVAYVSVRSVEFDALSACVDVLGVQHEAVALPELVEDVPLVELWPTEQQREQCVDAATTADFIDLLRFYYSNIWMPWDEQDDRVMLPNTIEDRMKLWSDLHNGTIPNRVARSISLLRADAIKAYEKLKELDSSICAEDIADEDDSMLSPKFISSCAETHAHLDALMSKWTIFENPLIREQYLNNSKLKWQKDRSLKAVTALWKGGSIYDFEEISQFLRSRVNSDQTLSIVASAEEALSMEPEEVIVCSKAYDIPEIPLAQISINSYNGATLKATEIRSFLLMLTDECRLSDLTLQCSLVNTVIVVKSGVLRVSSCTFLDDSKSYQSEFAQGLVAMSGAKVLLENCTFDNFYSGLVVHKDAQVELRNCVVRKCGVGVQMYAGSRVTLTGSTIADCGEQSIRYEMELSSGGRKNLSVSNVDGLVIAPSCKIGSGDLKKEILIVQQAVNLM